MRRLLPSILTAFLATGATGQEPAAPKAPPQEALELDLSQARLLRHGAELLCAGFSPDGATVATGGQDGRLRFWNPRAAFLSTSSGGLPTILDFGIEGPLSAFAFTPDGSRIAFAGGQNGSSDVSAFEIRVENVQAGKPEPPIRLRGHAAPVLALAMSPRGDFLLSGSADGSLRLWTLARPGESRALTAHPRAVTGIRIAPGGRSAFSSCADGGLREWDVASGEVRTQFESTGKPVTAMALSPDGRLLATSDPTGKIRVREVFSGLEVGGFDGHQGGIPALSFSPDGRTLASGGYDGTIRLWNLDGGKPRLGGIRAWVASIAYSPDGSWIIAGLADGTAAVFHPPPPDPEGDAPRSLDLAKLWTDLADREPRKALEAIRLWSSSGRRGSPEARMEGVTFLKEHLSPVPKDRLEELIRQLDSEEYEVRVQASGELERYGKAAEPALRKALQGTPTAEVRERAGALLKKLGASAIGAPDVLRVLRSIEILEKIDSGETRGLLESLAGGAESARETQEARASLERLRSKSPR